MNLVKKKRILELQIKTKKQLSHQLFQTQDDSCTYVKMERN